MRVKEISMIYVEGEINSNAGVSWFLFFVFSFFNVKEGERI